jgi:hypothetical protein
MKRAVVVLLLLIANAIVSWHNARASHPPAEKTARVFRDRIARSVLHSLPSYGAPRHEAIRL